MRNKKPNVSREYYNSMNSIIREYSKTNRSNPKYQTSNFELQDLFNNLYSSSTVSNIGDDHVDAEIKKFFNFMDSMYNHFIIGKSNTNINDYNSLLDVGTTISQEGNTTYREIYLLIDFFEGEINDKNKSQIFCNYVDNHLGELFEKLLIAKSFKDRTENWNAQLKRSALYSKSTGKSIQVQNNVDDKNQNKRRTDTDSSSSSSYRDKNNSSDLTYIFSQFVNQDAENKVQEYNQLTRANNDAITLFKMNQPEYKELLSIFTQNKDDTEIDEIRIGITKLRDDSKNKVKADKQRVINKDKNPSESDDSINTLKKEIIIHEFMEIIYKNMFNYFNKKGGYPNRTRRLLIQQKNNNKTKKLNKN